MDKSLEYFAAYLVLAAIGGLVLGGWWWFKAGVRSQWLPLQRVRHISWTGIDVFLAFWVTFGVPILTHIALRQAGFFSWVYGEPENQSTRERELLWMTVVTVPITLGLMLLCFKKLRHTRLAEMGLTSIRAGSNTLVAYMQWLLLTPLTWGLGALAVLATSQELQTEHPITVLTKQSLDLVNWLILIAGTVVMAPMTEEILFRGILLPWQVRGGWPAQVIVAFFTFLFTALPILFAALLGEQATDKPINPEPMLFVLAILPILFLLPFLRRGRQTLEWATSPHSEDSTVEPTGKLDHKPLPSVKQKPKAPSPELAEVAIFTNGLFFATLHSNVWPSPIPLFLLGIGLAWITYRTSSLVGAFTVHALFNGVSMLALLREHV